MLRQRVMTAAVLLALFLPAMFSQVDWPFALLTLVLIGAGGWEWGRLNGMPGWVAWTCGMGLAGVGLAVVLMNGVNTVPAPVWWLASGVWVLAGSWALKVGVPGWPRLPALGRIVIGVVVLASSWLAISAAKAQGPLFLFSIFLLVWVSDIAAYAGGRAFGRRKLALSISPGKSWEGVYCAMAAVVTLSVVWVLLEPANQADHSLYFRIWDRFGWGVLVVSVLYLAALGVMGDLLESLVKRAAGAKDSSRLLPGHGGVLDRIDALLPVFPAALALASL